MLCVGRATDIKGYVGYTYLSGFTIHVLYTPYKKFWNIDVRYVNMLSNAVSIFNLRFLSGLHCYFNELIRKIILLSFREIINKRAIVHGRCSQRRKATTNLIYARESSI